MIFDKNGYFSLDDLIVNQASWKTIMEDGIVTDEELKAQSQTVISLLKDMEKRYTPEQQDEIKKLLAETSVLFAAYHYHELQTLNQ